MDVACPRTPPPVPRSPVPHRVDERSVSSSSSNRSAERREREAQAARLLLVPGGADAQPRPAAGQDVERRRALTHSAGLAVVDAADHAARAGPGVEWAAMKPSVGPALEHRLLGPPDAADLEEVVHDPDRVEARLVGVADDPGEGRPDRLGAARPRERADLEADLHRRSYRCASRNRSFSAGITRSRIVPSPSGGLAPRTSATGRPAVLPSASSAADASSSATARTVVRITRPSASGWPRRSSSGRSPDTPSATSTMPQRHGRPKLSRDRRPRRPSPNRSRTRVPDPRRGGVGVDAAAASPRRRESGPTFEASTPRVRAHEAVARLGDQHAALHAHDPARLAQHDLDLARVAVPRSSPTRSACGRRLDRPQVDDGALGLGHDLLGDDEDVAGLERGARRASPRARRRSSPRGRRPRATSGRPASAIDLDPGAAVVSRHAGPRARSPRRAAGRRACRCRARARRGTSTNGRVRGRGEPGVAGAASRRRTPGSMTSGGSSSRAFVPLPWRSGARTTDGRAGRVAGREHALDRGRVDRRDVRRAGCSSRAPVAAVAGLVEGGVQAARPLLDRAGARGLGDGAAPRGRATRRGPRPRRGRRERRGDRAAEQQLDELAPLLRVQDGAQPRLRALERADGDRDARGRGSAGSGSCTDDAIERQRARPPAPRPRAGPATRRRA